MASIFTLPWSDIGAGIKPADGALLNFYDTGTYNRRDTYTDAGAGTAHANPVVADANGVFPAIYLDGTYRVVLTDKNGVQYEEDDGILSNAGDVATNTANIATNTANIATNVTDIATNTASISGLEGNSPKTGLVPSNAADADHDITISTGKAPDSTGASLLELSSAITKQIDNAWSVGDNLGGLFTGTVAADTTYHLFIIEKTSDGTIDAGFDTSLIAANIPTGYSKFRRVASVLTDSSSNIIGFDCAEISGGALFFTYNAGIQDLSTTSPGTSAVTLALSVPGGLSFEARIDLVCRSTTDTSVLVTSTSQDNTAPTSDNSSVSVDNDRSIVPVSLLTDSSSSIRYRSTSASHTIIINTNGYTDYRA